MALNAACINPLPEPPRVDRILVIRLGAVGDVLRTLPAFGELRARYPDAHCAWLVEPRAAAAVAGQPGVDELIVFPRDGLEDALRDGRRMAALREVLAFARALRARRFELVVDFHAILKSGLLARTTGARHRVGYARPFAREQAHWWANRRARVEPRRVSRFVRNAALVDFLGHAGSAAVAAADAGRGRGFALEEGARARVRAALGEGPGPLVVLHPGSSAGTPYKRYPARAWSQVLRRLDAEGARCRVAAGAAEASVAREIVATSGGAAELAPETASLGDLAALLAAADLFLGNDSGPLHLAALVGTPVVQVLGPTDPVENAPWPGTPARSVRVPVACSPCRRGCSAAACMSVVPPDSVAEAARELLGDALAGRSL